MFTYQKNVFNKYNCFYELLNKNMFSVLRTEPSESFDFLGSIYFIYHISTQNYK